MEGRGREGGHLARLAELADGGLLKRPTPQSLLAPTFHVRLDEVGRNREVFRAEEDHPGDARPDRGVELPLRVGDGRAGGRVTVEAPHEADVERTLRNPGPAEVVVPVSILEVLRPKADEVLQPPDGLEDGGAVDPQVRGRSAQE